jgi:hypothetical protein
VGEDPFQSRRNPPQWPANQFPMTEDEQHFLCPRIHEIGWLPLCGAIFEESVSEWYFQ